MKKSLLALAALSAIAGAAQAQSSVTVYGIADAGLVGYNGRASLGSKGVTTQSGTGFGDSAQSTSRLGFKGNEDLGGGMSAFFTVEMGLTLDSNQTISSGATQNRQSFVGLKKNGVGDFALGTQYTPIHNAVAATDPGQQNNLMGDMIYTANRIAYGANTGGNSSTIAVNPAGVGTTQGGGGGAGDSYTIRASNALTMNTATFGGLTGHAIVILSNANSNQTTPATGATNGYSGGINNENGWGLGADYAWHKLFATVAYQSLTAKNPWNSAVGTNVSPGVAGTTNYLAAAGAVTIFGAGQANTLGTNVADNQFYAAATYDFGILKAYAQYINRKATSKIDPTQYVSRSGEQIGVRSFVTPTIEAWAQGGLGRYTAFGAGAPTANLTSWQLGSNYWLSKRTNLYAIYGQQGTSNVSYTVGAAPVSYNANNYAVGVRHTF